MGSYNSFVLQINFIPIQYKFTVQPNEVDFNHFDLYEKQPIEYILTTQQIIKQEINQYQKELKEKKEGNERDQSKDNDKEKRFK